MLELCLCFLFAFALLLGVIIIVIIIIIIIKQFMSSLLTLQSTIVHRAYKKEINRGTGITEERGARERTLFFCGIGEFDTTVETRTLILLS